MNGQNKLTCSNQEHSSHDVSSSSFKSNDEVDLAELFKALWAGKLLIIVMTLFFAIVSVVFALRQPNIYQSQASYVVEVSFYGALGVGEPSFLPQFFGSSDLKRLVSSTIQGDESQIEGVSISYSPVNRIISIYKTSQDPQAAFDSVALFSSALNQALKRNELKKVNISIEALINQGQASSDKTKEFLDELLAQQIFKKALLEDPASNLIVQVSEPVKPTSPIKPKRALIVLLGTLLGIIFSIFIVLVRLFFRRVKTCN